MKLLWGTFGKGKGKQSIKNAVNYILYNCYFTVDKKIFSQIIGILKGSNPSPFFILF